MYANQVWQISCKKKSWVEYSIKKIWALYSNIGYERSPHFYAMCFSMFEKWIQTVSYTEDKALWEHFGPDPNW